MNICNLAYRVRLHACFIMVANKMIQFLHVAEESPIICYQ